MSGWQTPVEHAATASSFINGKQLIDTDTFSC